MANNQLLASDSFASGLAAGWTPVTGLSACQVVGAYAEANVAGTLAGQVWTGTSFPKDQCSEIVMHALAPNGGTISQFLLYTRMQDAAYSGYAAVVTSDGNLKVYRVDAGSASQLGTTITSLTFAAGDVWAFQAVGSILVAYKNWKCICWYTDATYASGSPGFGLEPATGGTIALAQASYWRGYNAVQQDGIWQKRQVTIPGIATDWTTGGNHGVTNLSQIIYEGGSQLGLGDGNVYKVWISVGQAPGSVWYCESLDGITWTRSETAVVANYITPNVIKQGDTYIMYAQDSSSGGAGSNPFDQLTSSDGVSWSLANSAVLAKSGSGVEITLWAMVIADIVDGTWYALYSGSDGATVGHFYTGLATSSDGVTWNKYGSNPVLNLNYVQFVLKISGTYYVWAGAGQGSNRGQNLYGGDPTECVRYHSTDLITWVKDTHSFHNSQMYESVNYPSGQCYPNWMMNVGGKAYAYLTSGTSDNGSHPYDNPGLVYQITLAVGPSTIENIVGSSEESITQVASDDFTSGAGDLSANWVTPTNSTKLKIITGPYCEASALATSCVQCYTGKSFTGDQYSEITIQTLAASNYVYPVVRCQTASSKFYEAVIAGGIGTLQASIGIYSYNAGTETLIGSTISLRTTAGDKYRLQVTGDGSVTNPVTLSLFQNGFLQLQVQDYGAFLTSGSPGIRQYATSALTNNQISAWAGGNAEVISSNPLGSRGSRAKKAIRRR